MCRSGIVGCTMMEAIFLVPHVAMYRQFIDSLGHVIVVFI
jgi:hypothetical protein